jgi:hypothetical protein
MSESYNNLLRRTEREWNLKKEQKHSDSTVVDWIGSILQTVVNDVFNISIV